MEYIIAFEDGSSACLAHYGVKGMKWGVRKDVDSSSYKLSKGYQIRRISSKDEAKRGTDLSKRFYASTNDKDFKLYRNAIDNLPGTSISGTAGLGGLKGFLARHKRFGVITLEAVDDATILKGKVVLNDILKEYGDTPIESVYDEIGNASVRKRLGLEDKQQSVNSVMKSKEYSEAAKNHTARQLVADVMSATNPDSKRVYKQNGKDVWVEAPGKKLIDSYKKKGYDAIEDIEDQLSSNPDFKPDSPLIVINGDKFRISNTKTYRRNTKRV